MSNYDNLGQTPNNQQAPNAQYQAPRQYQNPPYAAPQQPRYNVVYQQPVVQPSSGAATAALICGILAFVVNPMYIVSFIAIITGFVGNSKKYSNKGLAVAGLILGFLSLATQLVVDLLVTIFSFGMGFISFFI